MPSLGTNRAAFPMRPTVEGPLRVDMFSTGKDSNKDRDRQEEGTVMDSKDECERAWKPSKFTCNRKDSEQILTRW